MQKKLQKIYFDLQILAFELVSLNTGFYLERIFVIGCHYVNKQSPPRWNPPWRGEGAYATKRFHLSASTSRARRSDAATFDKD